MNPPKPKTVTDNKPPRRRPVSERKQLIKELDDVVSLIARVRDKTCVTPGPSCGGFLTASHWQKRAKMATRFDLRNVNAQCSNCNGRHNHYTAYYDAYMLRKYGGDVCLKLAERATLTYKCTLDELRELLEMLTKQYQDMVQ